MANRLRTSLRALPRNRLMSTSPTHTCPRSGWSKPIMCFNRTLLPSPLFPITVVSCPAGTVKSRPCSTRCPPKVFSTPTSLIMILQQDRGKEIIPDENQHRRQHDRFGRGRSKPFGAVLRKKSLITADPAHDEAETDRLKDAAVD